MTELEKNLKKAKQQYIQSLEFLSDAIDLVISSNEMIVEILEDMVKVEKEVAKQTVKVYKEAIR